MKKISDWLNEIYATFGKFVAEHWTAYWVVLAIISGGGFIGHFFGWAFSLFVPAWFLFVGFVLSRKYKNKK